MIAHTHRPAQPTSLAPRVMHVVSGGFSGSTQVAADLVRAMSEQAESPESGQAWLVLRRKRATATDRVVALRNAGLDVRIVPGWSRAATLWALVRLIRHLRPDVLVAHGFPEHLIARWAGWLAGVSTMVHVEHNSRERYRPWSLWQARWLARHTAAVVACSEGVRESLAGLGLASPSAQVIPNGIRLEPFETADQHPWPARIPGIVMAARFARQKDHLTLIEAVGLMKARGMTPPVLLAGGGKADLRARAEARVRALGLQEQVRFLGQHPDVPGLLMTHQVCVLATHWEGMPLSLIEGMAAGCAVVGSDVIGVRGLLQDQVNGHLVPESDPQALADALMEVLAPSTKAEALAHQGRQDALRLYGKPLMLSRYQQLFSRLASDSALTNVNTAP